ncbi:MAG TPA: metalloregulator ArsR/SmtB family transcription factor [Steroidobacteraceae bacterium]|jgi:DNA-binding transcriptional ArsR family regulator|nr:metalloregulator ArsR/SmtB family transcription factor [Steroidobacteraceae bacterium]
MTMVVSRQRTLADTTSLLSDASRATMLLALLDGRAYTASELARSANISAQAASFHLKRLVSANLLDCVSRGRYRYFRLAGPDVAQLLECLLAVDQIAHPRRIETSCPDALRNARACYSHIAGRAGVHLYRALLRKEWLAFEGPQLTLTAAARELAEELEFSNYRSSAVGKPCLDWSEREFHIAGELGVLLFDSMLDSRWFLRGKDRSLILTEKGRHRLAKYGLHPWTA